MRRLYLMLLAAVSFVCLGRVATNAQIQQINWGYTPTLAYNIVFTNPVSMATPPGETNRLFIVEKRGRIVVITNLAVPNRTIFMDISPRVAVVNPANDSTDAQSEEGLLSLAFHPGYATNRLFYVFYTRNVTNGGTITLYDTLSSFRGSPSNPNAGDPNSEIQFISQSDQANNHNGGDLHFGPDGYLYVSLGDEGGSGDTYANSQRIDKNFFSAIMRLDVNKLPGNLPPNPHASLPSLTNYYVPADNPWVGATSFNGVTVNSNNVRTEFWAVGMRNPWKYSFDPLTGELYLGHVGQDAYEWVNIVSKGDNCGWNYFEGNHPYSGSHPGFAYNHPLVEYAHSATRKCVIGGVVYRGVRFPALQGAYIYADHTSDEIWALRHDGTNLTQNTILFTNTGAGTSCFGVDPSNGDVLYAAIKNGRNSTIQRLVGTNNVPLITSVQRVGTNLVMSGILGPHGSNYVVLASTNVSAAPTNWTRTLTNPFDANGNFNFTNPINTVSNNLFYMIQSP